MKKEETPKRLTEDLKKELSPVTAKLADADVAAWFHYKNPASYATSPKKPWVENGLLCFLDFLKSNFVLLNKDDADTISGVLEDLDFAVESLTDEERAAADRFKNLLK